MFSFSWVIGSGDNAQGGNTDDVQSNKVIEILEKTFVKSGSITLELINGPEVGPESFQVESEGGRSVMSLGEDDGEDFVVRSYTNDAATDGKVEILGNEWDSRLVCNDQNLVKEIVLEFLTTGNVSRQYLS